MGEKAGLDQWEALLDRGLSLSLIEHDGARESYEVTPLLREELLTGLDENQIQSCHEAAFAYYKEVCEPMASMDPIRVEEWIYHALGCGEEDVASLQGGRLINHLWKRLAYRESMRVGEWMLAKKKRKLSTAHDAFLLNETAFTIKDLGDYRKAIGYYEQALTIFEEVYGETHPQVATGMNNLGAAWYDLGDHCKAISYVEQALTIDRAVFGDQHPDVARDLNNLGAAYFDLGQRETARGYFEKAYAIWKKFFGNEHPHTKIAAEWLEKC